MEEPEESVDIRYENVNDAPRMPVSGVYGGIEGDGMITAAFYHEHSIPNRATVEFAESGEQIVETRESDADVTRTVQAVSHLSPQQAVSIGRWLIEKGIASIQETPQPELEELLEQLGFIIEEDAS
jgi:predicted Zn-dependent protease